MLIGVIKHLKYLKLVTSPHNDFDDDHRIILENQKLDEKHNTENAQL